jgi:hypothetical protein
LHRLSINASDEYENAPDSIRLNEISDSNVIISVSLFSDKNFVAKTVIRPGIHTRAESAFFKSKVKMHSIEPFCTIIRHRSRISIPISAVVPLGLLIAKQAADKKHC